MNIEDKIKEFFTKFTKVVGHTTKHYEYSDVDPLELASWIRSLVEEVRKDEREKDFSYFVGLLGYTVEEMQEDYGVSNVSELEAFLREHMQII